MNPVLVLTALHPAGGNPPARTGAPYAFVADVRRALFASSSRPSSGWGA